MNNEQTIVMSPSISFIVPTAGREELARCLASIAPQLGPEDEVIIVGDTLDDPLIRTQEIVASFGSQFKYTEFRGEQHTWGHEQVNYGFSVAKGDYLHVNDDDDVWTANAVQGMREAAEEFPGKPLLFRFHSYFDMILWAVPGRVWENHIGGHCLLQPNIPGKIGMMSTRYQGDFDMIHDCLTAHGGYETAVWIDLVIAVARPNLVIA